MTTIDILCIGGAHVDLIARSSGQLQAATSNPGTITRRTGGVAFNVARGLAARDHHAALAGVVGNDDDNNDDVDDDEKALQEALALSMVPDRVQDAAGGGE